MYRYANTDNYDPLPRKALGYGLYSTLLAVDTLLAYGSPSLCLSGTAVALLDVSSVALSFAIELAVIVQSEVVQSRTG